jgi:hypothetical protein
VKPASAPEAIEHRAVWLRGARSRTLEALVGEIGQRQLAAAGQPVAERQDDSVGVVGERHPLEALPLVALASAGGTNDVQALKNAPTRTVPDRSARPIAAGDRDGPPAPPGSSSPSRAWSRTPTLNRVRTAPEHSTPSAAPEI